MLLTYREATKSDANLLINIYNSSFYEDYIHYGECPGYGKTKEQMELSIIKFPKYIIIKDSIPIGVISLEQYRNPELNKLYQDSLVRGPVLYLKDIFREMIRCGVLKENDPYQLAIEFFSPLFLLINMSDENESYVDIEKRLIKHIDFFIESHTKERENKNEIYS